MSKKLQKINKKNSLLLYIYKGSDLPLDDFRTAPSSMSESRTDAYKFIKSSVLSRDNTSLSKNYTTFFHLNHYCPRYRT